MSHKHGQGHFFSVRRAGILVLVCLLAVATALSGCGTGTTSSPTGANSSPESTPGGTQSASDARYTPDPNKPAYQLDPKEETTLSWYVNADWWNTDYGNDPVTRTIKEKLKLNIEFTTGDDTKLNSLFGSGQLPDIITIFDSRSATATKAASWALPLNDLADKYDPYFYKVAAADTLGWFQLENGKTYGYPSYSNSKEDYEAGWLKPTDFFVVREDIYKAIGEPSMSTEEEFLAALGKIKTQYPDVLPLGMRSFGGSTGSMGNKFQDFLGVPIANQDNTYYDRNLDTEYLRWVKIFNKAYRAGYISDDTFADDNTAFEEKVSSGRYAAMYISGAPQLSSALQKNITADPTHKYIAIDGPKSSEGHAPALSQSGISGWTITYISKNCRDTQKAIQLFTYLISDEGQCLFTYGVQGETYDIDKDGKYYILPDVLKERETNPDNFKKVYRLGEFCLFGHDSFVIEHGQDSGNEATRQMVEWGAGKVEPQFLLENINPADGTAEARNLTNINAQWATTLATLLRASDDTTFDKALEDYKTFLKNTGWDAIVKVYNEKMKSNAEKLGLN